MPLSDWLRTFRHPMALLVAATVVPVIIMVWLGWRLLREDQILENRRIQARLESAAEGIAAALDRNLSDLEAQLSALTAATTSLAGTAASKLGIDPGEDALVVLIDQAGVAAYPGGRRFTTRRFPRRANRMRRSSLPARRWNCGVTTPPEQVLFSANSPNQTMPESAQEHCSAWHGAFEKPGGPTKLLPHTAS